MNLSLSRAFGRRALAAAAALGTALLLVTCTGEPVAPGGPRVGQITVAPIWPEASRLGGLVLDNVRLTVVRLPSDTLARIARTFAPTTTQLQLTVPVLLLGPSENLQVTLELLSGTTLLFSGTQLLTVGAGGGSIPVPIPVTFTGPGGQVASLTLAPRDTTISAGGTFAFTVTAQDSQAAPVAQFYTTWSSSAAAVTIDGAGVVTAGAGRATVTITAVTPSGARDSTTLTVVPPATQLVLISGDNQSASLLSPLPLPLVVEVRAADGLPVAGATVTFAALSGGGSVDSATATTDLAGRATSGASLGATVGAQSFTATASGTNSVTFSATATSGGVKVWTGAVDGNWTTAGNWTPAAIPTAGDSVAIPAGTPNDPDLNGNATVRTLALQGTNAALFVAGTLTVSGAVVLPDTNSFIDFTSGQLSAGSVTLSGFQAFIDVSLGSAVVSGPITITGNRAFFEAGPGSALGAATLSGSQAFLSHYGGTQGPITASGSSAFWEAAGAVTVTGTPAIQLTGTAFVSSSGAPVTVTINGDVTVGGTAAFFDASLGDHWTINGNLQTTGGGTLFMGRVTDTVEVNGNVSFGGGDESTRLTAGQLFVSGNFSQSGLATSFVGTGTHTVFLDGSGTQTITFANPGFAASRFQNVIIANTTGGVTVGSDVFTVGTAGVIPLVPRILSGSGQTLFTTILNVSGFTFNNLLLNFTGSTVATFDTVTFQGYAPTATPLTIVHPGAAAPLPFQDIVFTVTPTSGFYLDATDSNPTDGVPLIIDMLNPAPASPAGRVQTAGGATVNWAGTGPIQWTGTVSTAWFTPGNWSTAAVPTINDDVLILSGTPNAPTISGGLAHARDLTVQAGAVLTLATSLQIGGSLNAAGTITGTVTGIDLIGTGTVRGNITGTFFSITVNGTYTLAGRLVTPGLTINGSLSLAGNTAVVGSSTGDDFQTVNNGVLVMTSALDSLIVGGSGPSATFTGGSTVGRLSAGVILMNSSGIASFTQDNTFNDSSYAPSGTHKVVLANASTTILSMDTPGAGSHFNILDLSAQTGGVTLSTTIQANGLLISTPSATAPAINGGSNRLIAGGGTQITGLTLTNAPMIIGGGSSFQFDNVTFQSMPTSASQLSGSLPGFAAPLVFNNLVFSTVPTTGFYVDLADSDNPSPDTLIVNLVNPTPATPGGFAQGTNGAVINWGAVGPIIWTGATSTNWNTASNWSTGVVPTNADDVVIPAGGNQPSVTGSCSAKSLTVNVSATLNLNTVNCQVGGDVFADGSIIGSASLLIATTAQLRGNVPGLILSGPVTLVGRTVVAGSVTITGASGDLILGGRTMSVVGSFVTQSGATLTMTNALDSLLVTGAGIFGGGFTGGKLTAGYLKIGGSFTQTSVTTSGSFVASGTHKTELGAAAVRVVNFASPGFGTGTSQFNDLEVTLATGGLSLASNTFLNGQLIAHPTGATPLIGVTGGPRVLTVGGVDVSRLTIDQSVMTIGAGTITQFDTVSFTGQANGVTQLTIDNPGAATPFSFTALSFAVTPTTGLYLAANDFDGATSGPLTINMVTASPAAPSLSLFTATGGAVVNWPFAAPKTWTGAVNTDWHTAGNWSPAGVPGSFDNVLIPGGSSVSLASCPTNAGVANYTQQAGSTVAIGACVININGNADAQGTMTSTVGGGVGLLGVGTTVRGNFVNVGFAGGSQTLSGPMILSAGSTATIFNASLTLGGHTLTTTDLAVGGGGSTSRLVMSNPLDSVVVSGNTIFNGADETGSLTDGVLIAGGSFTQSGGSSNSFVATGNHRTVLTGTAGQTVSFTTPGAGAGGSHFANLDVSQATGAGLALASDLYVDGTFSALPSGPAPLLNAGGTKRLITVDGLQVNGLTLDNVEMVTSGVLPIVQFDNVTIQNLTLANALAINDPGRATPYTFNNITFTSVPSTAYLLANDLTPTDGVVLTIIMVNATPANPAGLIFQAGGAVINWPPVAPVITWTGSVSTDWSDANNWTPAQVPTSANDVVIPAVLNDPVVTATCTAKSILVNSGGQLNLGAFNCQVLGNVIVSGTTAGTGAFQLQAAGQVQGNLRGLIVNAPVSLSSIAAILGDLTISGAGASFDVNGFSASVAGNLVTQSAGLLIMNNSADNLNISGSASFDGGNELGQMSAGTLQIGTNLVQTATTNGDSFHPSGTHLTVLGGANPLISFATPGDVPGTSHFQELGWAGGGTMTIGTDVYAHGTMDGSPGVTGTIASINHTLQVGNFVSGGVTFNGTALVINQAAGAPITIADLTFINMSSTVNRLTVNHPGTGGPFGFTNLTFATVPTTGFYISANDLNTGDATPLTIDVLSSSPATDGGFKQELNGASINWPPTGNVFTWDGSADNNWSNPANWDRNAVPGVIDDVVLVPITNQPVLTTNVGINNLTQQATSILDLGGFVLAVGGFADLAGTINDGVGGGGVTLAGTGGQLLQGTMNTTVLVAGSYLLNGNLTVGGDLAVNGTLDLGGFTATVSGIFSTINSGVVVMNNITSFLDVTGDALFDGGNTTGLLTAGTLRVGGAFLQLGTNSPQSFAADPGHRTELSADPASITFTTPGINGSHFGDLSASVFSVQIELNSDATILGTLDSGDGFGGSFLATSCPVTLTMTQWNSSAVLDCVQLVVDDPAGVGSGMSDVTFLNLPTSVTQLAIRHPGVAAGNFGAGTLNFVPLSGGDTGHYLDAVDLDGNPPFLVVDIFGSNVSNGPSFTTTSGGASVIWQNATLTWTGAVDNDWNTAGNWDLGFVPSSQDSVVIPATANQPALVNFNGFAGAVTVTGGTVDLNGRTLNVTRNFTTTGTGTLTMNLAFSLLFVGGDASFGGGSTNGLLTLGEIVVSGNFSQDGTNSATSFAPSGAHRTSMSSTASTTLAFNSVGAGAAGSHFALLNLSSATGGVTLGSNVLVDNTLESNTAAALIVGGGNSVTSKAWSVTGLTVDNAPMILNEGPAILPQTFDNVTFQGFPTGPTTVALIDVSLAGSSLAPRTAIFNATQLQTTLGVGGFYVKVASSNSLGVNLIMNGSNDPTGGFSRSQATPPATIQYQ